MSEISEGIKITDVTPEIPTPDGTVIVLQRHEEYIRKPKDDPRRGSLTNEGAMRARSQAESFFKSVFDNLSPEERNRIDILVVASDTRAGKGQRSMETAAETLAAAYRVADKNGVDKKHIINSRNKDRVYPTPKLREPLIFENSPEFVDYMIEKYGPPGPDFFKAFEEDVEAVTRKNMGAEGPLEMADRLDQFVNAIEGYAKRYHEKNPDRRLIVWATSHYDTITQWAKKHVQGRPDEETLKTYLPVDYGAGLTINVDPEGKAQTKIGGTEYKLN